MVAVEKQEKREEQGESESDARSDASMMYGLVMWVKWTHKLKLVQYNLFGKPKLPKNPCYNSEEHFGTSNPRLNIHHHSRFRPELLHHLPS